jgi:hypothetical protein
VVQRGSTTQGEEFTRGRLSLKFTLLHLMNKTIQI